jgi:N-acetylmuramoyl-L-alanine amidase
MAGQEYGTDYLLKVVEQSGELHLIATSRDAKQSTLMIGSSRGPNNGAVTKLFLNPGWRFTKRSYQGKELSHFYFSGNPNSVTSEAVQPTDLSQSTAQKPDQLF